MALLAVLALLAVMRCAGHWALCAGLGGRSAPFGYSVSIIVHYLAVCRVSLNELYLVLVYGQAIAGRGFMASLCSHVTVAKRKHVAQVMLCKGLCFASLFKQIVVIMWATIIK